MNRKDKGGWDERKKGNLEAVAIEDVHFHGDPTGTDVGIEASEYLPSSSMLPRHIQTTWLVMLPH